MSSKIDLFSIYFKIAAEIEGRSKKTLGNIAKTGIIKIVSILISFVSVPILIRSLNAENYGVWITINSIVLWVTVFDLGLSNGLRNKLQEAIVKGKYKLAKIYISTSYLIVFIMAVLVLFAYFIASNFINWNLLLNVKYAQIGQVVDLMIIFFIVRFILQLINPIMNAFNDFVTSNVWDLVVNVLFVVVLLIYNSSSSVDLLQITIVYGLLQLVSMIVQNGYFFLFKVRNISPNIFFVKFQLSKSLLSLGVSFFIIQISVLCVFLSNNLIISHYVSPTQAGVYNTVNRLFSTINTVWILILTPFLASFNDAYLADDIEWIRKSMQKLGYVFLLIVLISVLFVIIGPAFFKFWLKGGLLIPNQIIVLVCIHTLVTSYINMYNYFINSLGKIKVSTMFSIFASLVYLPLVFLLFHHFGYSLESVLYASIIILIPNIFLVRFQYQQLIKKRIGTIWVR